MGSAAKVKNPECEFTGRGNDARSHVKPRLELGAVAWERPVGVEKSRGRPVEVKRTSNRGGDPQEMSLACHRMRIVSEHPLLDRELYAYPEIDRILDLGAGTARRWINGYRSAGAAYSPVVRKEPLEADRATWGEFIEVYYLSRFRDSGIPLQRLRRTLEAVRERTEYHYVFGDDKVLYADSAELEVIYEIQESEGFSTFLVKRTGQTKFALFVEAKQRLERITYEEGVARALKPRLDLDHVVVHADRFFGKPKIDDTGISPDAVARLVWGGTPVDTVSDLYGLPPSTIDEAGRFVYGNSWQFAA